jgi:hypothetical protein
MLYPTFIVIVLRLLATVGKLAEAMLKQRRKA